MKRILSLVLWAAICIGVLWMPLKVSAATDSSKAGAVTTSGSRLNVRAKPSTSAAVVSSLRKGSYVTLISQSGSWWQVEFAKGKYGYCHSDYITAVSGTTAAVKTAGSNLNVRNGAGTSYSRTGSLANGEVVIVLSESAGWSRILYHGTKTGFVSSRYLSAGNSAVWLNVPDFKQTDSRWANALIGETGKTMAQIGCTTTGIAMMESCRTGTAVYPDAMSKKLTYTASGNVYWPSHYQVAEGGKVNLSVVYDRLKQGKPVLFGARNGMGKQHWVVIYGFSGGELTASGFAIRDPGSVSRTNLQQFLNAYPTFYKYFYWK